MNLKIIRVLEKEGIDFAFTRTTNYLTQKDEKSQQTKVPEIYFRFLLE